MSNWYIRYSGAVSLRAVAVVIMTHTQSVLVFKSRNNKAKDYVYVNGEYKSLCKHKVLFQTWK